MSNSCTESLIILILTQFPGQNYSQKSVFSAWDPEALFAVILVFQAVVFTFLTVHSVGICPSSVGIVEI